MIWSAFTVSIGDPAPRALTPRTPICSAAIAIRGSITQLDNQLRAHADRAPPAPEATSAPSPEAEPEPIPEPTPPPDPGPAAPQPESEAEVEPADDPEPDPIILRAAAGIAHATIEAHRGTWAFLIQVAGNEQHFHIPGKVEGLRARALPDWFRHYATRADETRFPKDRTKRTQLYERIGADGMHLLRLVWAADAPPGLRELPEAEILRRAWVQHFHLVEGEVRRRGPKDRPPGATRLASPYDVQARNGVKEEIRWDGYKVHLTETCEPDTAHLITHVVTTNGAVSDDHMAATVHAGLAARDLLPAEHWVDAGYANAAALTAAHQDHGIALHGPLKSATSAQSRGAATFGQEAFTIDWDRQQAGCPGGHTSSYWRQARSQHGAPVIRIQFSPRDCKPCPRQPECINSKPGSRRDVRRELTLRPRAAHETLQQARALQQTDEWKDRYKIRAGVEGTISQGVIAHGLRRFRYRGLAKASLQHQLAAAAINIARIDAHLTGKPHAPTRISPLAAPRPTG
ncbi:hypothetical protein BIV25_45400 [Streptomyces sp. MUSC 14]|nr:hypothetical protein BIV25_45400 [Streptomyces sp. MUSC 14]